MPRDGQTRADKNRAIRQDELRKQLASKKLERHVLDMAAKLRDPKVELDSLMVQRFRVSIDGSMRLIDKYLPSLKAIEHTGNENTDLSTLLAALSQAQTQPSMPVEAAPVPDTATKRLN